MIISENKKPSLLEFSELMKATDNALNSDVKNREDYYTKRNGKLLENDVFWAMTEMATGTPFESSIQLVSGASFPDIVANNYFGVEVKSTEKNHWKSIGSSILESTRSANVERIYLTFGKLGKPVEFRSRPYEECLSGIAVTHYPRYQIDMQLNSGETIFDKMGIPYDDLRTMENPVVPVSKYYRGLLNEGESLWWAAGDVEKTVPAKVSLWSVLSNNTKKNLVAKGYAFFPEVFSNSPKKYNRYALWLVTNLGIVNTNIRDLFSANGKVPMRLNNGLTISAPQVFYRLSLYRDIVINDILSESAENLKEYWNVETMWQNKIEQWCSIVANLNSSLGFDVCYDLLRAIML